MPGFSSLKMPPWLMWWKLAPSRQPPSMRKADLEAGAQDRVAAKVLAVAVEIKRRPRLEPDVDVLVGQDKVVGTGGVEDGAAVVGRRRADHGTEAVDAPRRRVLEAVFDGLIFVVDQIESADADRISGHAGNDADGRFGPGRTRRGAERLVISRTTTAESVKTPTERRKETRPRRSHIENRCGCFL